MATKSKNPKAPKASKTTSARTKPAIGLALGSGVARGFAHIGVLRALIRNGIQPTIITGTSVGALVGGAYLANRLDELEEWGRSLNRMRVMSYLDFKVRSGGLISGQKLTDLMYENFGSIQIEDLPHPFIAIAADLVTGHEVWLRQGTLVEAMRASFSLPGVFPPKLLNKRFLIDGALVNPVPVSPCMSLGARVTIAVDLNSDLIGKARVPGRGFQKVLGFDVTDPKGNKKGKSKKSKFWSMGIVDRLFGRTEDNPSLFGTMVSSLNIIQDRVTRSRLAGDPPDIHIKPRIGHIGLMEFEKADEMIKAGEMAVERKLPEIISACNMLLNYGDDDER